MSKEREAFESWIKTQPYGAESLEDAFAGGYQAATSHYQPLLDAKDAELNRMAAVIGEMQPIEAMITLREENTTLKALLEQARGVLESLGELNIVQGDCARIKEPHANYNLNSNVAWITCASTKSAHKLRAIVNNVATAIAAINATAGEK